MSQQGHEPPSLEEVFAMVEEDRETLRRENVNLRVIIKRLETQLGAIDHGQLKRLTLYSQALEARVEQLEQENKVLRDTAPDAVPGPVGDRIVDPTPTEGET